MILRIFCIFAVLLSWTAAASAAGVTVTVTGADGRPVQGAVVTVTEPGIPPAAVRGPYVMAQQNIAFAPHLLIVPVGAVVKFPNFDQVRHHVYSFSTPKKFELKLYGRDETKSVQFDKPGVVAIGCNIHDSMSAFIFATSTPYIGVTDGAGRVSLNVAPSGKALLAVWHPSVRAPGNSRTRSLAIPTGGLVIAVSTAR
ncbi:methylamine utilization protein [Novosphingobium aquiterrae]|uniref:Methylamine utilization protein n=1 Tax=Novosphingobium aquiterrae TaxID=624388 RepID=A0ABV6PGI0_9SPHN